MTILAKAIPTPEAVNASRSELASGSEGAAEGLYYDAVAERWSAYDCELSANLRDWSERANAGPGWWLWARKRYARLDRIHALAIAASPMLKLVRRDAEREGWVDRVVEVPLQQPVDPRSRMWIYLPVEQR